jgi:phosphate transport system permease protein
VSRAPALGRSASAWSGARRTDRLATAVIWGAALLVAAAFLWILGDLLRGGLGALSWEFLTAAPQNAGRAGGIGPILVSTGLILFVALATSLPLSLATAVFLAEFVTGGSTFGRLVRGSLDVLAGVPSIVFGLFGNAFFALYLGLGFSILAGGLTLACMVLPILIRSIEQGLRAVPQDYRQGAAALGMTRSHTLIHLLLPAAVPGMLAGTVLGVGRAAAETAALIFTSGYVDRMPGSLLDSGRALSVHIYDLSMNVSGGNQNAYGSALVLLMLLLLINLAAGWTAERWLGRGET